MSSIASGGGGGSRVGREIPTSAPVDRIGRTASRGLATLMVVWALILPLAPVAASTGGGFAAGSAIVYTAGSLVCHQRPERSFSTRGRPWPVCARCAGIYLAAGVVALAGLASFVRRALPADTRTWRRRFVAAVLPVAVTWGLERFGVADVSSFVRALSGAGLGAAVAAAVVSVGDTTPGGREDLR